MKNAGHRWLLLIAAKKVVSYIQRQILPRFGLEEFHARSTIYRAAPGDLFLFRRVDDTGQSPGFQATMVDCQADRLRILCLISATFDSPTSVL